MGYRLDIEDVGRTYMTAWKQHSRKRRIRAAPLLREI